MPDIRIYTLAKHLKIDSNKLVGICDKLGIVGKRSAIASLSEEEVVRVGEFIGADVGALEEIATTAIHEVIRDRGHAETQGVPKTASTRSQPHFDPPFNSDISSVAKDAVNPPPDESIHAGSALEPHQSDGGIRDATQKSIIALLGCDGQKDDVLCDIFDRIEQNGNDYEERISGLMLCPTHQLESLLSSGRALNVVTAAIVSIALANRRRLEAENPPPDPGKPWKGTPDDYLDDGYAPPWV